MRILISTMFKFPQVGGVSNYIVNLRQGLEHHGHNVTILSGSDAYDLFSNLDWAQADKYYHKLAEEFSMVPSTVVQWETLRFLFQKTLSLFDGEYDIVHANDAFSIDLLKKRFPDIPVVLSPHASIAEESVLEKYCSPDDDLVNYARAYDSMVSQADAIIGVSKSIIDKLCTGISREKVHVVYSGVEANNDAINCWKNEVPKIITVARMMPIKAIDVLLMALSYVENQGLRYKCDIIGDGALLPHMKRLSKSLGLGNVSFLGSQEKDTIYKKLSQSDIFVLSSLSENLPLAIIEAMHSKCAIIGTDVGGIPEIITSGYNGVLVPPGSVEQLGEAFLLLLKNESLRTELAENAFKVAKENFTLEAMASKTLEAYSSAIKTFTNHKNMQTA